MNNNDNLQQPRVLLATSLAPRDLDNQRQAVQSWLNAGFDVVSVNNPDEIPLLQPHFSAVRFVAASRNGAQLYGKPLIFIDDILDALKSPDRPIVGIINSDIHLHPDPDLWRQITRNAKNALLYLRRTNVNYLGDPNGELLIKGIDLFFMSQSTLRQMPSSQFCLGVSWWDVYFPAYCAMTGIPLKKIDAPIAFHIKHTMNWDERQWQQSAEHFYQCMYNLSRYAQQPSMLAENESRFLSLWKFYHGIRHKGIIPKDQQRMIGSKLVHHVINQATQTLTCPPLSAPAAQQNLHDDTLQLFQKAQDAFESGQMLSARKWMAQYQAQMDYNPLPRTDRRQQSAAPAMSVILVTYGRSKEVGELLDDLAAQDYRQFETILVDNGHTDLSQMRNAADCVIHCPINFKPAEGRNIGVHFARGSIIVFIDDDARIPQNYLSSISQAFQTYRILGLRGKTMPKTPSGGATAISSLGDVPYSTSCNQEGNAAFLAWAWRAVAGQDPLLFGHEGIDLSWRLKQAFNLNNAILYCPDVVIYHDYGDSAKKREKNIRYVQINNYLRYKYDCDITQQLREYEKQPLIAGNSLTWTIPMPADLSRWRSLCYAPMDTAIRALPGVKVSIIISCYNAEPFLAECLDSICAQTLTDWEAIIVDDGSKDRSPEILRQYAARDGRFRIYLNNDNKGPYQRRNFAIRQAQAPFIVLHDADDIMAPQKLEILLGEILKDDRLGIVGSFYGWFRGQFEGLDCCDRIALKMTYEEIISAFLGRQRDICCHAAAIMRKSLFEQIGLYDVHPWGADSFWLTKAGVYMVLTNQVRCKNVPEYLSFIRKHSESQTGKINPNDPRGRRRHFVQYFRAKLQEIVDKRKQDPYLDVAAHLRQCTCSDFIPMYGHLFEQWESEPLDIFMIKCRMDTVVSELVNRMYVRTEINLNTLESMLPQAGQKAAGFNLMRGLCQFVFGQYTDARESMLSEYQLHQTVQAKRFLDLYLNFEQINCNIMQRRKIVDDFIFNYPEIEHPAAEIVYDNCAAAAASVSVIMDCRYSHIDFSKLIGLWAGQQTRDFELVLLKHKNSKSDFASLRGLPLNLVVVNTDQAVTRATAKNLALRNCRGNIIAFISPHLYVPDTLLKQMIECFSGNDLSAVRGKILTRDILLPHPEYHLGDTAHYSCADTDKFCAVTRREIERIGGFDGGLFDRELLGLSHAIYNQKPDDVLPILYQPKLEGIINTDVQTTDYLLFAMGNHQLYWRLSAPLQFDTFTEFASNYFLRGDTAKAFPAMAERIAAYFTARCLPVAMEWARKANLTLPDKPKTTEHSPLVSVIMPAYNAERFIESAVRSVLMQTQCNLELIIVNDGSTDNTEQIIRQFNDTRIRIESQSNAGPAAARNRALQSAAGQFIVFLDADDVMTPDFIADHLREFESNPDIDLVYCDDQLIDDTGKPMRVIKRKEYESISEAVYDLLHYAYPIVPFRTCIRKRVFEIIGLYDTSLQVAEDYDMIRRFFAAGLKARHLKRSHYLRRTAAQSQSRTLSREKARMHLGVIGKYIDTFAHSWLFPDVNWGSMTAVEKQTKAALLTSEFFLSQSLNYLKMTGFEAYAETALEIAEGHLRSCGSLEGPEAMPVIRVFEQTQQLVEKWKMAHYAQAARVELAQQPYVSVVISCLNMADYLPECLDSILAQTLQQWELIVVDDGSTDRTQEILNRYARADRRIRVYLNSDTRGPYIRRNFAIEQARAPLISIQDADDIMALSKLETLFKEISADSSLGIVGSYFGQFLDTFYGPDFCDCMKKRLTHAQIMESFSKTWHICWHGSAMIRRSLFEYVGLYDSQPWGSDTFWLAKAGLYAQLSGTVFFKNIPRMLTYKREHAQSQTSLISAMNPNSRRMALHRYGTEQLEQISQLARSDRSFDYAAAIKTCSCNDFIPKFGHLFEQWESAPLNPKQIQELHSCAVSECAGGFYVGAAMTLSTLCGISAGIEKTTQGLNLMRGVCCYAYGDDTAAQRYLKQEYSDHKTEPAMQFIKHLGGVLNGKQRRRAADQFVYAHILSIMQPWLGASAKQGVSLDVLYALAVDAYKAGEKDDALTMFEKILAMPFAKRIEEKIFGPKERQSYTGLIDCYRVCSLNLADCYAAAGQKTDAEQVLDRLKSNKNLILETEKAERAGSMPGFAEKRAGVVPAMAN